MMRASSFSESSRCSLWVPVLLLLGFGAGCTHSKPVVEFPTLETLNRLATVPVAAPEIAAAAVPAGGWTVDASHAAQAHQEAWQPAEPWGQAFASSLPRGGQQPRLSRAMACIASELGRFRLAAKKEPPRALHEFILGACGAISPQVGTYFLQGSVPAEVSEAELLKQWSGKLENELAGKLPPDATDVGFWFGRSDGQALALVTYSQTRGESRPFSLTPDASGNITFEGRVAANVEHFAGYINQGRYGVESCLVDPGVPKPQFRIVCHMAPEDRTAWVQLVYAEPRRVLASSFIQTLVRRTPTESLVFTETAATTPQSASDAAAFSRAVLDELNAARAQAQLTPVQLADAQSATAARLAGHYFAAALGENREAEQDQIALGLLAGWQVPGMIRHGSFFSSLIPFTRDPSQWLNLALTMPSGRATLLSADIEQIALGPLFLSSPEGLGAVVTGYQLHHSNDHSNDVLRLFLRLSFARQNVGLGPAKKINGLGPILADELKRVNAGEREPSDVMQEVLQRGSEKLGVPLRGYIIETTSLEALQIPPDVMRRPSLQLAIGVTHHKPIGAAWAQFAILVVYVDGVPPGSI